MSGSSRKRVKRQATGSTLDISIHGDELEQHRIQLEHNLQHTDLSLRLSLDSDGENDINLNNSSVEYPRHYSGPPPFPEHNSILHRSGERFLDEDTGHMNHWSYRTGDEDEGINPYGGETISTVAHHASALTLNAGLGGGRGARREVSLSGAEYDPERPLQDMIAGVDRLSALDMDPSRSKYMGMDNLTFDPIVVDSTADLDRILESGHAPLTSLHSRSAPLSSPLSSVPPSDSDSESANGQSRPKLSDALRRVSFSPKRPRSPQIRRARSPAARTSSPLSRLSQLPQESMNMPTPRSSRSQVFPSNPSHPEVKVQPPSPSITGSNFTRMARGITREIEAEKRQQAEGSRPMSAPPSAGERNPFHEVRNQQGDVTAKSILSSSSQKPNKQNSKGKVTLPDVTGLTSAVESPAKFSADYYPYRTDDRPRDSEARLLQILSTVQTKLYHLEEENSISRRRVRELEAELEECKREVVRERSRLIEQEEVIVQQQQDLSTQRARRGKGKGRTHDVSFRHEPSVTERYTEAVEEKKALEALILSLRTHLTRLTTELSSHQALLTELRNLRESDARSLRAKSAEITHLKEEVERLAGEVEVLRGVVEEGLKERRSLREISVQHSEADVAISQDVEVEGEPEEESQQVQERSEDEEDDDEEGEPEPFDPQSIHGSSLDHVRNADRTMRTDHATLGSSLNFRESGPSRFVDSEEFERISAELEDRRSDHSGASSTASRARSPQREPASRPSRPIIEDMDEEELGHATRAASPVAPPHKLRNLQATGRVEASSSRPHHHAPNVSRRPSRHHREASPMPETPFPQIRGEHLERLFFSAPEHNARTCNVCFRRRGRALSPLSLRARHEQVESPDEEDEGEDEGFAEGSEQTEPERYTRKDKGKQREHVTFSEDPGHWRQAARREGLPPQTVVTRVIRDLEDDFTHYKSVYVELADQYKEMDAVSNVPKRNVLAQHLREVVDILEQKGDQIASLYDLLTFKDKPAGESIVPIRAGPFPSMKATWDRNPNMRRRVS